LHWYGAQDGLPGLVTGEATHVPVAQTEHAPGHDVLQQTPPTHRPLPHTSAVAHATPLAKLPAQMPAAQLPLAHSAGLAHAVPMESCGTHVPAPPSGLAAQ
jgi:hypothetical protein